jgi:hypothetical protein
MSMSGSSGRTRVRIGSLAVAIVAGFGLLAGCGRSDGAGPEGSGTVGSDATADGGGDGTGTTDGTGSAGGGGGGGSVATKACQLVTSEEAAAALGGAVTNSVNDDNECYYEAGASNLDVGFTTEAFNAETVNTLTQLPGMQKIDGVGDAAFRFSQQCQSQFHVWTKGKYLVLMIEKPSGDTATVGRALLDKALSRF